MASEPATPVDRRLQLSDLHARLSALIALADEMGETYIAVRLAEALDAVARSRSGAQAAHGG
jgi:hypothetical protein